MAAFFPGLLATLVVVLRLQSAGDMTASSRTARLFVMVSLAAIGTACTIEEVGRTDYAATTTDAKVDGDASGGSDASGGGDGDASGGGDASDGGDSSTPRENCTNGTDDDGDGRTDCEDTDCVGVIDPARAGYALCWGRCRNNTDCGALWYRGMCSNPGVCNIYSGDVVGTCEAGADPPMGQGEIQTCHDPKHYTDPMTASRYTISCMRAGGGAGNGDNPTADSPRCSVPVGTTCTVCYPGGAMPNVDCTHKMGPDRNGCFTCSIQAAGDTIHVCYGSGP